MSIMIAEMLAEPVAARRARARIELVSPERWEAAIGAFDGVSQEQLTTFAALRWPGVDLEPVLISAGGTVIGGCLMMIQRLPLGLASIAVAKWGPFLRSVEGDALFRYGQMIDALTEDYARRRRMMLSLLALPAVSPGNAEYDLLVARGFRPGTQMAHADRYIVRLDLDQKQQRDSLDAGWRRQLAKAEKSGLVFERATPDRLPEFDRLYARMVDRKGFEDRSAYRETVPALLAMADDALRPELFLVSEGGETIAGAIIFTAGDRAVYLYGATSDRALPLRAGYFLHWQIISWLKAHSRARWYDLGGTDGFEGLHRFKKGMVGTAGVISPVPPVANYAAYRLPMLLGQAAFSLRDALQKAKARLRDRRRSAGGDMA